LATSTWTLVTSGQVARHAVGGEDHHRAGRHLVEFVDEDRPLGTKLAHHVVVVDDLVTDVHRRAESFQRALDDLDRAIDARAETARLGEQGFGAGHQRIPRMRTSKRSRWPASG
jgi:hypothetical protein